jgi:hypothetical protein
MSCSKTVSASFKCKRMRRFVAISAPDKDVKRGRHFFWVSVVVFADDQINIVIFGRNLALSQNRVILP